MVLVLAPLRPAMIVASIFVLSSNSMVSPFLPTITLIGRTARVWSTRQVTPTNSVKNMGQRACSSVPLFPDESDCRHFPINVIDTMKKGADWENRLALQTKWSNEEKGWQVQVEWKMTPVFGVGLFAAQDIPSGKILRIGTNGYNLMQFRSVADIEEFCKKGIDEAEYKARLYYVKDYMWGYSPSNTDERGYDLSPTSSSPGKDDRFFGMWIPGNGLNHNPEPNTVYRTRKGGTGQGIVLVALRDITAGEELYDDYRRHGRAPQWLLDFAKEKQVTLNFADCNDFVDCENSER